MSLIVENEQEIEGVPVCAANMCSPVVDAGYYAEEIHYRIVTRLYIENADGGGLDGY